MSEEQLARLIREAVAEAVEPLRLAVNRGRIKYSYAEAAKRLRISERTLFRRIEAGAIRSVTEGGRSYILEEAIRDYEDEARTNKTKKAA